MDFQIPTNRKETVSPVPTPTVVTKVLRQIERNLVVLAPLILSAARTIDDGANWKDILPVLIGLALRQWITSPTREVAERERLAFEEGQENQRYYLLRGDGNKKPGPGVLPSGPVT